MPFYLLQVAYSNEEWALLVKHPQDREGAVGPVIKKLGGNIVGSWLTLGEFDAIAICEMPDNVTSAAFSMAAVAGGAIKTMKTTVLLTAAEALAAMKLAGSAGYTPPT